MFYSNCLLEALKAKTKNPKQVKVTYLPPQINECFCPHFMWSDGKNDYDFGVERHLRLFERIWFLGEIRTRKLGFNERWKKKRMNLYNIKHNHKEEEQNNKLQSTENET